MASTYYTIHTHSVKHYLLRLLANAPAGLDESKLFWGLVQARPTAKRRFMEINHLKPMVARDALTYEAGIYLITPVGRRVLSNLEDQAGGNNIARPNTINKMTGTYTGSELKRTAPRPGSMAAYDIASLINGKLESPKHV